LWLKTRDHAGRNGVADEMFDAADFMTLAVDGQGKGSAITTRTTGTTNAVYVVFRLHR
jgi:hypothetical protein